MSEEQEPTPALDPDERHRDERDPEAPEDDAQEQATPANPADEPEHVHVNPDVNEYDAVEQAHVVELDEDYR